MACQNKTGKDFVTCALTNGHGDWDGAIAHMKNVAGDQWAGYSEFLLDCQDETKDPSMTAVCLNHDNWEMEWGKSDLYYTYQGPDFGTLETKSFFNNMRAVSGQQFNSVLFSIFHATRNRLNALWPQKDYSFWWPRMYQFYNTPHGKRQIDAFIAENNPPPEVQTALKNNFTEYYQKRYGLINMPDVTTIPSENVGTCAGKGPGIYDPFGSQWQIPTLCPDEVNLDHWLTLTFEQTDFANKNNKTPQQQPWGNPMWTTFDMQKAWRQVLGKETTTGPPIDGKSFLDEWAQIYVDDGFANPGKSAEDYFDPEQHAGKFNPFTDPDYAGQLPSLVQYATGAEPWHQVTTDPKSYGYVNPCYKKPVDLVLLPWAGAGVGAIFGGLVVPGSLARVMGAATLGSTGYLVVDSALSWGELGEWAQNKPNEKAYAATIISVGAPMTLTQMLFDLKLVPEAYDTMTAQIGLLAASAALGYVVLLPVVKPVLTMTDGLFSALAAPISLLSSTLAYFTSGCASHEWISNEVCRCEDANVKPALVDALVGPIYGCTGQQKVLRAEAARAVITNPDGEWGSDPYYLGTCDGNGHVDNPFACISAGEWAYKEFVPDLAVEAEQRWEEFSDVFDPANESFLPPRKGVDEPCAQYGKYFRMVDGKCVDKRAPKGKQGPGEFDWSTVTKPQSDECTIL